MPQKSVIIIVCSLLAPNKQAITEPQHYEADQVIFLVGVHSLYLQLIIPSYQPICSPVPPDMNRYEPSIRIIDCYTSCYQCLLLVDIDYN